jgi:group II intron reverse transcriptase/maturase
VIDDETWQDYATDFKRRIDDLHGRIHRGAYRAKPSKQSYIPKPDGKLRPLGIAALEDKIVQQAARTVLECVYEEDFLGFSYGFRPERGQHQALDALYVGITKRKVSWIIDADLRGFFDNISHEWLMKFLEHRIVDPRMLRLLKKWLRAGVSEDGEGSPTKVGTPQGAVISPLLANLFLHYVLDLWINDWRKRQAKGEVIIVRYADDFVIGFRESTDTRKCLVALRERFAKFGLELHPEKTRLIQFGRYAEERRANLFVGVEGQRRDQNPLNRNLSGRRRNFFRQDHVHFDGWKLTVETRRWTERNATSTNFTLGRAAGTSRPSLAGFDLGFGLMGGDLNRCGVAARCAADRTEKRLSRVRCGAIMTTPDHKV